MVDKSANLLSAEDQFGGVEPDAGVLAIIKDLEAAFDEQYGVVAGTTKYPLNAERTAASPDGKGIRLAEQNLGNLVTDALRFDSGSDVALFPGVMIRASIGVGDLCILGL